jgi:TetR/AcrR family transcriptional repressor of lmrAB and yxaGH operons
MCERGVHATGLTELLQRSGSARGSIYQHFPGGKSDLMEQATYAAGRFISRMITSLLENHAPDDALVGLIDYWIIELETSDFARGCPIQAAAQSGAGEPAIQAAAAAVFNDWCDQVAETLIRLGVPREQAVPLASFAISSVEGAITQSRAKRSTQPLEDLKAVLVPLTKHTLTAAA